MIVLAAEMALCGLLFAGTVLRWGVADLARVVRRHFGSRYQRRTVSRLARRQRCRTTASGARR